MKSAIRKSTEAAVAAARARREAERRERELAANSRQLANSTYPRLFHKAAWANYGVGNIRPTADDCFMASHSINPLRHPARDKAAILLKQPRQQVMPTAVIHASTSGRMDRVGDRDRFDPASAAVTGLGGVVSHRAAPLMLEKVEEKLRGAGELGFCGGGGGGRAAAAGWGACHDGMCRDASRSGASVANAHSQLPLPSPITTAVALVAKADRSRSHSRGAAARSGGGRSLAAASPPALPPHKAAPDADVTSSRSRSDAAIDARQRAPSGSPAGTAGPGSDGRGDGGPQRRSSLAMADRPVAPAPSSPAPTFSRRSSGVVPLPGHADMGSAAVGGAFIVTQPQGSGRVAFTLSSPGASAAAAVALPASAPTTRRGSTVTASAPAPLPASPPPVSRRSSLTGIAPPAPAHANTGSGRIGSPLATTATTGGAWDSMSTATVRATLRARAHDSSGVRGQLTWQAHAADTGDIAVGLIPSDCTTAMQLTRHAARTRGSDMPDTVPVVVRPAVQEAGAGPSAGGRAAAARRRAASSTCECCSGGHGGGGVAAPVTLDDFDLHNPRTFKYLPPSWTNAIPPAGMPSGGYAAYAYSDRGDPCHADHASGKRMRGVVAGSSGVWSDGVGGDVIPVALRDNVAALLTRTCCHCPPGPSH